MFYQWRLYQLPRNIVTYLRSCIHTTAVPMHRNKKKTNVVKPPRYNGYVNKFPMSAKYELVGLIVRNDEPEKEYIFHIDDLISIDIDRVRQYQAVEFEIIDGSPYQRAKRITGPNTIPLKYWHKNSDLPSEGRTMKLSQFQTPNTFNQRFHGIVCSINDKKKNGFIMPTRLQCEAVYFDFSEIHSCGIAKVEVNDSVSFCVLKSLKLNQPDIALSIRRSDEGLITFESYNLGNFRRTLGNVYGKNDIFANVPSEYLDNRYRGYIIHRQSDGLIGYILVFDDEAMRNELVSVHVDNCHFSGNRKLRRFQQVEFCIEYQQNQRYKYKAIQVTAPNLHILRYNEDNHFLNAIGINNDNLCRKYEEKECAEGQRFHGIISNIKQNFYEISPNVYGYKNIFAANSEMRTVGNKAFMIGDAVEYHIDFKTQRAYHVTAHGGWPFLCEYSNSEYSKYLRTKLHLSTFRRDFEVYNERFGEGFITFYDQNSQCGTIEVIGMNEMRYKNILFHAKDVDKRRIKQIKNQRVEFELMRMEIINGSHNEEFIFFVARNDLDLTKRAIKIRLAESQNQRQKQKDKIMQLKSRLYVQPNNVRDHKLTQINQLMQRTAHLRY